MGLRIATIEDFDLVMSLAGNFVKNSPYSDYVDEGRLEGLVKAFLTSDGTDKVIILSDDCGMLAGHIAPFAFGQSLIAMELAWWVEPSERGKSVGKELLEGFEFWAKRNGCKLISLACLDDSVGKFYERRGYKLYERTYFKEA